MKWDNDWDLLQNSNWGEGVNVDLKEMAVGW